MKLLLLICFMTIHDAPRLQSLPADTSYIRLSQLLLYAVRTGDSTEHYIQQLSVAGKEELNKQLSTDAEKKAFWLNIYNAFVQKLLMEHPEKYKRRSAFFTGKQIVVASTPLSLDDIEHGILRRSKVKWSMGYLNKLFPPGFEKQFRLENPDHRIHFALNCGAKSCPPIAYYDPAKIDTQLELAEKSYLASEAEYDQASRIVSLPKIMSWFRGDFGGKDGIKDLLKKHKIIDGDKDVKLRFRKYDWTLFLNNYTSDSNKR